MNIIVNKVFQNKGEWLYICFGEMVRVTVGRHGKFRPQRRKMRNVAEDVSWKSNYKMQKEFGTGKTSATKRKNEKCSRRDEPEIKL